MGPAHQSVHDEKHDHQPEQHVVGRHLLPKEGAGTRVDRPTRVTSGDVTEPEEEGLEGEGEDQRDDSREDDAERPTHCHIAEQAAHQPGSDAPEQDAHHDGKAYLVREQGPGVPTETGQGADAEKQLAGAPKDQVEPDRVAGIGETDHRDSHVDT